jgi:hypothetical protein
MALTKDSTGYYLEPSTGQYYTQLPTPERSSYGYGMNLYGGQLANNFMSGMPSLLSAATGRPVERDITIFNGKPYLQFTGNAAGISQGKRSVVDAMIGGRQPYQYNVPSLSDMFPDMQGAMQQTAAMPQGNAGAGRFLGGLLGSMPTPVSTTTTQAPSSGAGRYL